MGQFSWNASQQFILLRAQPATYLLQVCVLISTNEVSNREANKTRQRIATSVRCARARMGKAGAVARYRPSA